MGCEIKKSNITSKKLTCFFNRIRFSKTLDAIISLNKLNLYLEKSDVQYDQRNLHSNIINIFNFC